MNKADEIWLRVVGGIRSRSGKPPDDIYFLKKLAPPGLRENRGKTLREFF